AEGTDDCGDVPVARARTVAVQSAAKPDLVRNDLAQGAATRDPAASGDRVVRQRGACRSQCVPMAARGAGSVLSRRARWMRPPVPAAIDVHADGALHPLSVELGYRCRLRAVHHTTLETDMGSRCRESSEDTRLGLRATDDRDGWGELRRFAGVGFLQ